MYLREQVLNLLKHYFSDAARFRKPVNKRQGLLLWLFSCFYAAMLFRYTFTFPMVFEDYYINARLSSFDFRTILSFFAEPRSAFGTFYRPTGDFSQWLLTKVFGYDPLVQHIVQFGLTCAASGLMFRLIFLISRNFAVSFWSSVWFMVSGVQALYYMTGCTYVFDRLSLVFTLAALVCSVTWLWVLSPLFLFAALTTKETALVFPGLLVVFWAAMSWAHGETFWSQKRRLRLCAISVSTIFLAYCLMRWISAGGLSGAGEGPYNLTLDPAIILRNASYYGAYLSENFIWASIKGGSFEGSPTTPPQKWWLTLALIPIAIIVISLFLAAFKGGSSHKKKLAPFFFGAGFLAVSIFPFLFIEQIYRAMLYLVYFASVGSSVLFGCFTAGIIMLLSHNFLRRQIWFHTFALLLVAILIVKWQPHVVLSKNWYRSHLEMGTQAVPYLLQSLTERVQHLEKRDIAVVGATKGQQMAIYFLHMFQPHLNRPQTVRHVSSLSSLDNVAGTAVDNTKLLAFVPLTDRFGILSGNGATILAGQGILNGNFDADAAHLGNWRPAGWVPASHRAEFLMKKREYGKTGVNLPTVLPGMNDGIRQTCLLVPGSYKLAFACAAGNGAVATLDIRQEVPMDVLKRVQMTNKLGFTYNEVLFDAETTGPYSLVFGSTGSSNGWISVSDVSLTRNGEPTLDTPPSRPEQNLMMPLADINSLVHLPTGSYLLKDNSTTASAGWPTVWIDCKFVDELTKYCITVDGRGLESSFVQVMVTPEYDDPDAYQFNDVIVIHLPLHKSWTKSRQTFSVLPWCRRLRLDFAPVLVDEGVKSTGSVELRNIMLQKLPINIVSGAQ